MGRSASGILYYGYAWDDVVSAEEDEADPDDEDEDYERGFVTNLGNWAESVLKSQGHINPWTTCPEDDDAYPAWEAATRPAIDAWYELRAELTKACPVDWGSQGSGDYMIPYLFIKGSEQTSYGSEAVTSLAVGADWNAQLDAFLASQDITPPEGENQPGWWLTSYYG